MESNRAFHADLQQGDLVVSLSDTDYSYLVGRVKSIDKLGSPEHETDNETDDVHVDFSEADYSDNRIGEIERHFTQLYGEGKTISDISLDDVIMPPDQLLRITELEIDDLSELLESHEKAEALCYTLLEDEREDAKLNELLARVEQNYEDYNSRLYNKDKDELISMADAICATSNAYSSLTMNHCSLSDEEIDFLLKFDCPLDVVADAHYNRNLDFYSDVGIALEGVMEQQDKLMGEYPLVGAPKRYMDVDVTPLLGKIANDTIVFHPKDWEIDQRIFARNAVSENTDDKTLMWLVGAFGTHVFSEREVYITDNDAYRYWTDYRPNDPSMRGFVVELTGEADGVVKGNVFDVGNYPDHARHVFDSALPCAAVTLLYNNGDTLKVGRAEFDRDPAHYNTLHGYPLPEYKHHPTDEAKLDELLRQEKDIRMGYFEQAYTPPEQTERPLDDSVYPPPNKVYYDTIYALYSCDGWSSYESMKLVGATTDKESLYAMVGEQILDDNMDYNGMSGLAGLESYRSDYQSGRISFGCLHYGYVEETENFQIKEYVQFPNYAHVMTMLKDDEAFQEAMDLAMNDEHEDEDEME